MRNRLLSLALAVAGATAGVAGAQTVPANSTPAAARAISLEDAIRLADRSSETVEIARAGVTRASGQQTIALSQFLPQVNATASYARTLRSQFAGLSGGAAPDTSPNRPQSLCAPEIPANATPAERQAALDQASTCQAAGGINFSKVGFGALNQWALGLQFSQNVFTGGRATGQRNAANAGRRAADIELTAQRAQLVLDVTQAYYNTVLASRLVDIAQTALNWNDDILRQTTRARQVGSSSEFDLLRAQVARDNQVPVVLQRRSDASTAMLRLKQLLDLPLDDSLTLTTPIDEPTVPATAIAAVATSTSPDTNVDVRASVREAAANVAAQHGLLRAARADYLPSFAITSGYQRLFFPTSVFPQLNDFRENWTVGVSASVSLFNGGRSHGGVMVAEANLREARARLEQTRQFAALDARVTLNQLAQAEATWRASAGTAEQAQRAYSIDQIRYREGLSTQTDLTQSQMLVEQAMVNRAVAARDLAVARMKLALLKDLPLSAAGAAAGAGGASAPTMLSAPQTQQQQPQQRTTTGTSAGSASGSQQ
ncbi:MAG TPA: TolC family protein [Gemmatimonadaceae bacterium]|nr:TolC family protein [Gemmatimonadaceae bacterium]